MRHWLSATAALTLVLVGLPSVHAQEELTVSIVSRADDGFRELISQFEKRTGRKVKLTFPNFMASRDLIVKGEPFDLGIVEFPHDADVVASGNVVPGPFAGPERFRWFLPNGKSQSPRWSCTRTASATSSAVDGSKATCSPCRSAPHR